MASNIERLFKVSRGLACSPRICVPLILYLRQVTEPPCAYFSSPKTRNNDVSTMAKTISLLPLSAPTHLPNISILDFKLDTLLPEINATISPLFCREAWLWEVSSGKYDEAQKICTNSEALCKEEGRRTLHLFFLSDGWSHMW